MALLTRFVPFNLNPITPTRMDSAAPPPSAPLDPDRRPPGDWPAIASVPVSVLVPVKNEQANIVECLRALRFAEQVVVVDSQSTDRTVDYAEAMGAQTTQFHYNPTGWPKKKNWALEHVAWRHEWVLIMDADERMTPELAREIEAVVNGHLPPNAGDGDGFYLNRRFIFMGRWIKHCGYYPSYNIRLFKHRVGRYERIGNLGDTGSGDNEVHEHVILRNGSTPGYLKHDFEHLAYPNLQVWIEKHNRYSNWEAHAMIAGVAGELHASLTRGSTERRRWIKHKVRHLPLRPTLRFFYSYIIKLGFLDGYPGYVLSRLMSWYEFVSLAKRYEMCHDGVTPRSAKPDQAGTLQAPPDSGETHDVKPPGTPGVTPMAEHHDPPRQLRPEASPWSFRDKAFRALWMLMGRPLFRLSFHNWYAYRRALLRRFGAIVGRRAMIRPTAHIEIPWNLDIGEDATVGDHAILYSLGRITIGDRAIISQYAHLCAGTHDYTDHTFKLLRTPITIGDDCWVGTDAFIGPGVTVGNLTVVGARSSAYKDLPPGKVCVGNPAKPIKDRVLR